MAPDVLPSPRFSFPDVVLLSVIVATVSASFVVPDRAAANHGSTGVSRLLDTLRNNTSAVCASALRGARTYISRSHWWDMVLFLSFCTCFQAYRIRQERRIRGGSVKSEDENLDSYQQDLIASDPGLLRKHSTFSAYTISLARFPSIRTFYRAHPQAAKLPNKPRPLPLLVFVHGLGGSVSQFAPILTSLVNAAPCLGIDLPGCGLSQFSPRAWNMYTQQALAELLVVVIRQYVEEGQQVVLVAHSMGCSLAALVATWDAFHDDPCGFEVAGLVAVCPRVSVPSEAERKTFRRLLSIPTPLFDLLRKLDQRGGPESSSVTRFVGEGADKDTRKLQWKYNLQSRTVVWRRMAWAFLLGQEDGGIGFAGPSVWSKIRLPVYAIAGQEDHICRPEEVEAIAKSLRGDDGGNTTAVSEIVPDEPPVPQTASPNPNPFTSSEESDSQGEQKFTAATPYSLGSPSARPAFKSTVLPAPANHTLLYSHSTYRTLSGLIQTFLYENIDPRLSPGWQLQHLCTEGKWDVKNLAKWQAVKPVSEPIGGLFRAMKTLREVDRNHAPTKFTQQWNTELKAVIDVSHESPVYDPKGLDAGGIAYHKFPTVSKIPPTEDEVRDFGVLVDKIRSQGEEDGRLIGVHCHYGYNRSGFFICAFLIARKGLGVQAAIDEFRERRPPGIRHEHFLDTLFVRYATGGRTS